MFVEKKSKFIGYIKPVQCEADAMNFISEIKTKHWDATHNVYAYSIRDGNILRYSDDGEPQGTAGMPVLDVLRKSSVTDTVIVATRYFGGTLLGAGGLVRAYSHTASIALSAGKIIKMQTCAVYKLVCDYGRYGPVRALIENSSGTVDDAVFESEVELFFHLVDSEKSSFEKNLAELTCGAVKAECIGEAFFECEL